MDDEKRLKARKAGRNYLMIGGLFTSVPVIAIVNSLVQGADGVRLEGLGALLLLAGPGMLIAGAVKLLKNR